MASQTQQNWEYARQIRKKLHSLVKGNAPTFEEFEHLISQLRIACESVIFLDIEYAAKQNVEGELWDSHITINTRFRNLLQAFKKGDQRKHVVEKRKVEKRYVDFIKTSQYFYKGYIQRLASHYDGLGDLYKIAHRLSLSVMSVDDRVQISPEARHMVRLSCYTTLLRLGDLSRYRNTLRTKDRSWDAALAYYTLANDFYPDSGQAHNQMSIISLQEGDHLDGVYHIYRALAVKEVPTLAKGNMDLEFKKIIMSWEKRSHSRDKPDSLGTLITWFTLLHAKFYEGVIFSTHAELEKEVLSRLTQLLKEQKLGDILEKFVLINLAAEDVAANRLQQNDGPKDNNQQTFLFALAFNVRFMLVLLQALTHELEEVHDGEVIQNETEQSQKPRDTITTISRRVLPAIRQYSIWLNRRAPILASSDVLPGNVAIHVVELWKTFANVLTRLVDRFPIDQLAPCSYLFEEDCATIGFRPFHDPEAELNLYSDAQGEPKPRITDKGVERNHPNAEMQARVLDILVIGLKLQLSDEYPIVLNPDTRVFNYVGEGGLTAPAAYSQNSNSQMIQSPPYSTKSSLSIVDIPVSVPEQSAKVMPEESGDGAESQYSLEMEMQRMVESIVEGSTSKYAPSNETSYGMHSKTANEVFAPLASNGVSQPVRQNTPKQLPSLPGIWSSPFTPQPNELALRSPNRPTTGRQFSPTTFATDEQRLIAAQKLDRITGHGSWAHPNLPSKPLISQPENKVLQDSLAQQFTPTPLMPSSNFTDSSSLYAGTPEPKRFNKALAQVSGLNNTTYYSGGTDFNRKTFLQSSVYDGSQPAQGYYTQTPPGGQGG